MQRLGLLISKIWLFGTKLISKLISLIFLYWSILIKFLKGCFTWEGPIEEGIGVVWRAVLAAVMHKNAFSWETERSGFLYWVLFIKTYLRQSNYTNAQIKAELIQGPKIQHNGSNTILSNELEHHFLASDDRTSNFEPNWAFTRFTKLLIELTWTSFFEYQTKTCSSIGNWTQTPYFWLRTIEH